MAKPFRLQRVLEHRLTRERQQLGAVAETRTATQAARTGLAALIERKTETEASALAGRRGRLQVDEALRVARYAEALAGAIGSQEEVVRAAAEAERQAEAELLQRRQERRALETLRARHVERAAAIEQRREAALHDEVAMARAARRQVARTSGG